MVRYEEAADLGSQLAEDNAIFLYDNILLQDCSSESSENRIGKYNGEINALSKSPNGKSTRSFSSATSSSLSATPTATATATAPDKSKKAVKEREGSFSSKEGSFSSKEGSFSSKQYVLSGINNASTHEIETAKCRAYLHRMTRVRLLHLVNNGNHFAARILADNMIEASPSSFKTNETPRSSLKFFINMKGILCAGRDYIIKWFLPSNKSHSEDSEDKDYEGIQAQVNVSENSSVDLKGAARSVYSSLEILCYESDTSVGFIISLS